MSTIKFAAAPFYAATLSEFSYGETLVMTIIGGIVGVFFFFYLTPYVSRFFYFIWRLIYYGWSITPNRFKKKTKFLFVRRKFTWKNRMLVKLVKNFGLVGVALITPALISIPLGTFVATKYFKNKRKVLAYLCTSVVLWGVILSAAVKIL